MKKIRDLFGGFGNSMFQMAYLYAQARDGKISDVYVQDFKYFDKYKSEIRQLYGTGIGFTDLVALHIRRGDYVGNNFYVDLTKTNYYQEAVSYFPNEKFLIFCADRQPISDDASDREWCTQFLKTFLPEDRFQFWWSEDEVEDMNKMAGCKSHIMANSTFSTWAAWLNSNPDKVIIAPKEYYTDKVERTVLPKDEGWIYV